MLRTEEIQRLAGHDVYDRNDDKIGTAGQVFVDTDTREPEWLSVKTGLFGKKESFVPASDAEVTGDALHVPFEKAQVKDARTSTPPPRASPPTRSSSCTPTTASWGGSPRSRADARAPRRAPEVAVRAATRR